MDHLAGVSSSPRNMAAKTEAATKVTEIIYYAACSLDNYIARSDGQVDWLDPFMETEYDHGFSEFFGEIDGLIMGSTTYEIALQHPPWLASDRPSWILTSKELPLADPSVTLTNDKPAAIVEQLKTRGLKKVWLLGGGRLATSFRQANLITHYEIAMVPVILGSGIRLLNDAPGQDDLEFIKSTSHPTGIVSLSYRVVPRSDSKA